MTRTALALTSLALVLAVPAAEAGAAALKPLPVLNGVRCRAVVNSSGMSGYSCGRTSDLRSYVVTIEIAKRSPYGPRPSDQHLGQLGALDANRREGQRLRDGRRDAHRRQREGRPQRGGHRRSADRAPQRRRV